MATYQVTEYARYEVFNNAPHEHALKSHKSLYQAERSKVNLTLTEARLYIQEKANQYKTVHNHYPSPDAFWVYNTLEERQIIWQIESWDDPAYPTPGSLADNIVITQYPLKELNLTFKE